MRPSALAAFRFMSSSNLFGRAIGRSAALAPLNILSTNRAISRYKLARSVPYDISPPASTNSRMPYRAGSFAFAARAVTSARWPTKKGPVPIKSACRFSRFAVAKALSKSLGPRTLILGFLRPRAALVASNDFKIEPKVGSLGMSKKPIRVMPGTAFVSSSSCLPTKCSSPHQNPVTLLPGRDKLAATPSPTGSCDMFITIGIVCVAL